MDVDGEIDSLLLQQFSSMGTTDRDVLVAQFQKLVENKLSNNECEFFLEMNKWNLQEAVCAFYDYNQPATKLPSMSFVEDITIGEGESVLPDTNFTKSWKILNSGNERWPQCWLRFMGGERFGSSGQIEVDRLFPGQVTEVNVQMHSPAVQGFYQGQWRMMSDIGTFFGETIWVILQVDASGILSVTQQMSRVGSEFTSKQSDHQATENPFASPQKLSSSLPNTSMFGFHGDSPSSMVAQHGSTPSSPRLSDSSQFHSQFNPLNPRPFTPSPSTNMATLPSNPFQSNNPDEFHHNRQDNMDEEMS